MSMGMSMSTGREWVAEVRCKDLEKDLELCISCELAIEDLQRPRWPSINRDLSMSSQAHHAWGPPATLKQPRLLEGFT